MVCYVSEKLSCCCVHLICQSVMPQLVCHHVLIYTFHVMQNIQITHKTKPPQYLQIQGRPRRSCVSLRGSLEAMTPFVSWCGRWTPGTSSTPGSKARDTFSWSAHNSRPPSSTTLTELSINQTQLQFETNSNSCFSKSRRRCQCWQFSMANYIDWRQNCQRQRLLEKLDYPAVYLMLRTPRVTNIRYIYCCWYRS